MKEGSNSRMEKFAAFNGFDFYYIKDTKFKTICVDVFFIDTLDKKRATLNAAVPAILRRGCEKYPSQADISTRLEELYGASFDCGINKKGDLQLIHFHVGHVSSCYVEDSEIFSKGIDLLKNILTKPLVKDGAFISEYVEQEKENMRDRIRSKINDKIQYSINRCFEEMCKGEAFSIYQYGDESEVDSITTSKLYDHYIKMLREYKAVVFISGDLKEGEFKLVVDAFKDIERIPNRCTLEKNVDKRIDCVNYVNEKMDVNQGKLCMGFRSGVVHGDENCYKMMVYNGILGGGMHSKLFQNVREKESLAYFCFSSYNKFKGYMIIGSGIEAENKEKALKIILEQLTEIKNGNITDEEIETTIKTIKTSLNSVKDEQISLVDFYLGQLLFGKIDDFDDFSMKLEKVTKEDVIAISEKVELDTVYFLSNND